MSLFKKKGDKLAEGVKKLLEMAESQIAKATKIEHLTKVIQKLSQKNLELCELALDIAHHSGELLIIQADLNLIAIELDKLVNDEKSKKSSLARAKILSEKANNLKIKEAEAQKRVLAFENQNIRLENINKHQEEVEKTVLRAQEEINKLLEDIAESQQKQMEETNKLLEESMQKLFPE